MSIRRMMLFTLGSFFKSIISLFKTRVLSSSGNFEAETNLETQLNVLGSDLFNSASLVITPNAYKENVLFSATPSPVGNNLLLQSEGFTLSPWILLETPNITRTANAGISPIGINNATLLTSNSNVADIGIRQVFLGTNTQYVFSLWARSDNGAQISLDIGDVQRTTFTLTNTWQRLQVVTTPTSYFVDIQFAANQLGKTCLIWGAQLEIGTTAGNYIPTTTRQVTNETICDLTVTRATTATRVNEQGLIEVVPYNLITYSETLENTQWLKSNVTIAQNSIISPNGDMTGDKLIEGTNNGLKYIRSSSSGTVGIIHTASIYLKANTRTWAYLTFGWDGSGDRAAYFNLIEGVVGNLEGGVTASIVATGNDWYRCTITGTMLNNAPRLSVSTAIGNGIRSYLGDGISSIYAWGAQLVKGTEPKPYQLTTNRLNVPRIDYTTSRPAILVEPQRTNLLLQSEDFTNGWTQEGTSVLSNTQISPDGALTADSIFELATNDVHRTYRSTAITVTANAIYTASFFVKKSNIRYIRLILTQQGSTTIWAGAQFDLETQTFTSQVGSGGGVFSSASITPFINGWYRISVSGSIPGTSMFPVLALSNGSTLLNTDTRGCPVYLGNVNNELYVWGGQLELGSNITSYIPTTTSTVTRNADNISKTGIINLIGQTEGTIFCEFERTTETAGIKHILTLYSDGWLTNSLFLLTQNNGTDLALSIRINSTNYQRYIGNGISGKNKLLLIYDTTGCDVFLNGTKLTRLSLPSFPSLYNLGILHYNAGGRQYGSGYLFSFWKTKLSDQQAIKLTTL
jgi:hypothetical protein